jgi:HEAT repeat protein
MSNRLGIPAMDSRRLSCASWVILWGLLASLAAAAPAERQVEVAPAERKGEGKAAPPPASAAPSEADRIAALLRRLGELNAYDAREEAKRELLAIGAPAVPALIAALRHETPRARRSACELLGRLKNAAAIPPLVDRLRDDDAAIRGLAMDALERIGPKALEAVKKARDEGRISAAVADPLLGRSIKREVESLLDHCISKELGFGFYKDQFKPIVDLGAPATRVLLQLFTTPEAEYEFTYTFDEKTLAPREETLAPQIRYRKQIIHRLAGEALVDMKDRSVIPALKAFVGALGEIDPLDERDPRQDYYETTAFALMRLGEPGIYEKLKDLLLAASSARIKADGTIDVELDSELKKRQRQFTSLSRLAMLQIKADDLPATERTYNKIIELALVKQDEAAIPVYDADGDGKLDETERKARDEALDAILRGAYRGRVTPALQAYLRDYAFYRGVLRGAYYNLACTLAQMDKKPGAVDALLKAVRSGYEDAEWIKRDRDLDSIKGAPEYKRLIQDLERKKQREEERIP